MALHLLDFFALYAVLELCDGWDFIFALVDVLDHHKMGLHENE